MRYRFRLISIWLTFLQLKWSTAGYGKCIIMQQSIVRESPFFDFENNYVSLTVAPDIVTFGRKRLVVSWRVRSASTNDLIAVFDEDPMADNYTSAILTFAPNATAGCLETELTVHVKTLRWSCHDGVFENRCFEYWVAYIGGDTNKQLVTNCLKVQPNWMDELPNSVKSLGLNALLLPGTHDSGAYDVAQKPLIYFEKYVYTQDVDVLNQLCYGIRYLDLRVGYDKQSDHLWWLHHEVYPVRPLSYILEDIRTFVEATNEIVIIEFHKFHNGFSNDPTAHIKFYQFVTFYLGKHMAESGWNKSLRDLQNGGRRVIVTYKYLPMVYANPKHLWTPIQRYWPNVQTVTQFEDYVYSYPNKIQNKSNATVLMAELTPTPLGVILNKSDDLRHMSSIIKNTLSAWFASTECGEKCNIIAVDFVQSTDLIDAAIYWNKKKIN